MKIKNYLIMGINTFIERKDLTGNVVIRTIRRDLQRKYFFPKLPDQIIGSQEIKHNFPKEPRFKKKQKKKTTTYNARLTKSKLCPNVFRMKKMQHASTKCGTK